MTNFKIVPVEPVEEMLRNAMQYDAVQDPADPNSNADSLSTDWRLMLAAAPVINIVATKNEQGQIVSVTLQDEDHRILEVIAEADVQGEPVEAMNLAYELGGCEDGSYHLEADELEQVIQTATQSVHGEPVGYIRRSTIELMKNDELGVRANIIKEPRYRDCVALYTALQPAEQQPEVLAKGYFHPLPDENDYEFHAEENFPDGNDCPDCVPAVIVRKSAVVIQPAPDLAMRVMEALAAILRKAQGRTDTETGECIDVGAECMAIRREFDRSSKAARGVSGLVEALERISKRASEAECRQTPCSPIQRLFVDIMQQADDALAAYRQEGGEK